MIMLKRVFKKILGDEFDKFNSSSLALSTGVSVVYYENDGQSVLEFHDPFKDLIDMFFLINKEAAIETLKRLEQAVKKESRNESFSSVIDKTKSTVNEFINRKCYNAIPFIVVKSAKKFGSNKKKREQYFRDLDKYFNNFLYDN